MLRPSYNLQGCGGGKGEWSMFAVFMAWVSFQLLCGAEVWGKMEKLISTASTQNDFWKLYWLFLLPFLLTAWKKHIFCYSQTNLCLRIFCLGNERLSNNIRRNNQIISSLQMCRVNKCGFVTIFFLKSKINDQEKARRYWISGWCALSKTSSRAHIWKFITYQLSLPI